MHAHQAHSKPPTHFKVDNVDASLMTMATTLQAIKAQKKALRKAISTTLSLLPQSEIDEQCLTFFIFCTNFKIIDPCSAFNYGQSPDIASLFAMQNDQLLS